MKTAFPYWRERIAPVFDTARHFLVIDCREGAIVAEEDVCFDDDDGLSRVRGLVERQVAAVVCGALSTPLHHLLVDGGIRVIPFVAGDLRQVVEAWRLGRLDRRSFAMPGCRRRRGRFRGAV